MQHLFELFTAFFATIVASLIGNFAGGSSNLILLPILLWVGHDSYVATFAIAKSSATLQTLVSSKIHAKKTHFYKKILIITTIASLIGTFIGTYLLQFHFNEQLLKQLIGITIIASAFYIILFKKEEFETKKLEFTLTKLLLLGIFSTGLNIINGLIGGTGIFLTAYFIIFLRLNFRSAIAHTFASYIVCNLIQTVYLLQLEPINLSLFIFVVIGAFIGSTLGTNLLYLKENKFIKIACPTIMILIGLSMLIT